MDEGRPISYVALAVGTPVVSSWWDGVRQGSSRPQVPELDLFDGISVTTKHGLRFVDREQITEITTTVVRCSLTDERSSGLAGTGRPPSARSRRGPR